MHAYQNIIKQYVGFTKDRAIMPLTNTFFYIYYSSPCSTCSPADRFAFLSSVLDNVFMTDNMKSDFFDVFSKIQRTYRGFSRFAQLYINARCKVQVSADLYMNPLVEGKANVISIIQNHSKYLFSITDIINMLTNAITHSCFFFAEPLACKNPYNNLPFNKADLYNIYFFIRKTGFIMPTLIHHYFLTNFNLRAFCDAHEELIREHTIRNYIETTDISYMKQIVSSMFSDFGFNSISIHASFPPDILIPIMKPYLFLYYSYKYGSDESKRRHCRLKLRRLLRAFVNFNPRFGRRIVLNNQIEFNMKHKRFLDLDSNFDCDHLSMNPRRLVPFRDRFLFSPRQLSAVVLPQNIILVEDEESS